MPSFYIIRFFEKHSPVRYHAQVEEFVRLFEKLRSHIDGHHHMHLCANLLLSNMIPARYEAAPQLFFLAWRKKHVEPNLPLAVDRWLACRYRLTDYFFDLTQCIQEKTWIESRPWRSQPMWN